MNAAQLTAYLDTPEGLDALRVLYGAQAPEQAQRYGKLLAWHTALFGEKETVKICSAPGRAEIAGNHTDHNHGRVLAAAVNLDTVAAASKADGSTVTLWSEGFDQPFIVDLSDLAARDGEKETTAALIRGVAARMAQEGLKIGGFDAAVTSTVFKGSGLSSSAAFEVMLCQIFDSLYNGGAALDAQERARVSQYAENVYFGKPSGLLDQMASSVGSLVTMDFENTPARIEALRYDFEAKGYALAVVAAGSSHDNLTGEYAAIPAEMKRVAKLLGGEVLRDVPQRVMEENIGMLRDHVSERAILRAYHFYGEDARVPELVDALKRDDLPAFLRGIVASGDSSWELLQNLYVAGSARQEMALALEMSRRMLEGRGAWRIHGGGFAGTILAFVPLDMLETYFARMEKVFGLGSCMRLAVRPVGPATVG